MQTFVPITVILTVVLKHWACWYGLLFFIYGSQRSRSLLKASFSFWSTFSHIFHAPWPQSSVTAIPLLIAGEKVKGFIRRRCQKHSLRGLGQSDHHSQLRYNLTAILEDSPAQRGPRTTCCWCCWLVCLPHCRKCWWEVNHTSSKGQVLPSNLYPVTAIAFYRAERRPIF